MNHNLLGKTKVRFSIYIIIFIFFVLYQLYLPKGVIVVTATPSVYEPETYNETYVELSAFIISDKIVMRANVSDSDAGTTPIDKVVLNLTASNGTLIYTNEDMTNTTEECPPADCWIYEKNYTLQSVDPHGVWIINVTANDTQPNYASNSTTFLVGLKQCMELDTANKIYYLIDDINGSETVANKACINITAVNVTLNCYGFRVYGNDTDQTSGVYSNSTNSTVRNCNVSDWRFGIHYYENNNGTIENVTANSNIWSGIRLRLSSNNTITNITLNDNDYSIDIYHNSDNNTLTNIVTENNTIGIYFNGAGSNIPKGNILNNITAKNNTYGIYLQGIENNVTNSSIYNNSIDYYLTSAGATDYFRNTNFTDDRKIKFSDTTSWFIYANNTEELWLKSNVSAQTNITRELLNWNNTLMIWNDTNDTADITMNYNITGLLTNTVYGVFNNSVLVDGYQTDGSGNLNFTIYLSGENEVKVEKDEIPPKYQNNSTNSTKTGTPVLFSLNWTDDYGLSGYIFAFNNGTTNYENLSTYTIVGSNTLSISDYEKKANPYDRDVDEYVYKDYGAGCFTNFEHLYDFKVNSSSHNTGDYFYMWGMSNDVDDAYHWQNGLAVETDEYNSYVLLRLEEHRSGTTYISNYINTLSLDTWYYARISRTGSNLTLKVYGSDSNRANDQSVLATLSLTVANTAFRYLYAMSSANTGNADREGYGHISNLTLQFVNDPWTNDGGSFSGIQAWSNVTKVVNETIGVTIKWRVYANDTSDNWNASEIFSFITTGLRNYSVPEPFTISQTSSRIVNLTKILTEILNLNEAMSRIRTGFGILSQFFSLNFITSRISSLFRTLTEPFSSNIITSRTQSLIQSISQSLSINIMSLRILTAYRSISSYFTINLLTTPLSTYLRSLSDSLGIYSTITNAFSYVRPISQQFTANIISSRLIGFYRSVSDSFITNMFVNGIQIFIRDISQMLTINTFTSRLSTLYRSIIQPLTINVITSRIGIFFKSITEPFATAISTIRLSTLYRSITSYFTISTYTSRVSTIYRSITSSFIFTGITGRMISVIRIISNSLTISTISSRLSNIMRLSQSSLTINQIVSRTRFVYIYTMTGTAITDITERLSTILRLIPENLLLNNVASRIFRLVRIISEPISIQQIVNRIWLAFSRLFCFILGDEVSCTLSGCYWCSGACQATTCSAPIPPTPSAPSSPGGGAFVPPTPTPVVEVVLDTEIRIETEEVLPGEKVYATITVLKARGPLGATNVNLSYWTTDTIGNIVASKTTVIAVETIRKDIYFLSLPSISVIGNYSFEVLAQYNNVTDTTSANFQVVSELPPFLIDVKQIDVPMMMKDQPTSITIVLENLIGNPLNVTTNLYLPENFEPKNMTLEKIIQAYSEEIYDFSFVPRVFGSFNGFIKIEYEDRKMVKDFPISVFSPLMVYEPFLIYWWLIVLIIVLIVMMYIAYKKFKRKEKYVYRKKEKEPQIITKKKELEEELRLMKEMQHLVDEQLKEKLISKETYEELKTKYKERILEIEKELKD